MLFSSYSFIFLFLPPTLVGYLVLARYGSAGLAKGWLTAASLVFYGYWDPSYLFLISGSMLFNHVVGRQLSAMGRLAGSWRAWLAFGVVTNVAVLAYYKYANFIVNSANDAFGTQWLIGKIVLPLGISFFTFTQIAYLIDASQGKVTDHDFGDYLLFVTFFPHLIAGPIIHHSEMMPQFRRRETFALNWSHIAFGLSLFSLGLFKKVVIADNLSSHVARMFGAAAGPGAVHIADAWAGILSYTFQIYFDFSGYSDMAIALARMFGIVLPANFDSPYRATSLADFWRRWHMTLSRFLRDYLYIPLGGNRVGEVRRYVNLVITMVLGGFWHGAAWTFLAWGFLHGFGLALNHLWMGRHAAGVMAAPVRWRQSVARPWVGRILTLLFVIVGWVYFRSPEMDTANKITATLFGFGAEPVPGASLLIKPKTWVWLVGLLAVVWFLPNTGEIMSGFQGTSAPSPGPDARGYRGTKRWFHWQPNRTGWVVTGLLIAVGILGMSGSGEFLYYNF